MYHSFANNTKLEITIITDYQNVTTSNYLLAENLYAILKVLPITFAYECIDWSY